MKTWLTNWKTDKERKEKKKKNQDESECRVYLDFTLGVSSLVTAITLRNRVGLRKHVRAREAITPSGECAVFQSDFDVTSLLKQNRADMF